MADLAVAYTADATEYSQTTIAWSEKVTLAASNFTAGNDYLIFVNARTGQSAGGGATAVFVDNTQVTALSDSMETRKGDGNTGFPFSAAFIHTAPGTPVDIGVGGITYGASWTWYIDDTVILAIDLDSLAAGDYYSSVDSGTHSLTSSWATYNTLTFTPANDGDRWLIFANINGTVDSAFREPEMRIRVDGTTEISSAVQAVNTNGDARFNMALIGAVNLDNTEHDITVEMQEVSAANEYEASTIVAIRLSAFVDNAFDYNAAVSSGNPVEIAGLPTFTPTNSGDIIVIGTGSCDSDSDTELNGVNMTIDGTVFPANHSNYQVAMADNVEALPSHRIGVYAGTASTAIDIDVDGYEEGSAGQFENCYAVAFSVELAGGDPGGGSTVGRLVNGGLVNGGLVNRGLL